MPEDVTFYSKNEIQCPVCGANFRREDLLSGRGRLNAGELTNELRRMYIPTQKYGEVNPLLYPITVCPNCFYSVFAEDFLRPKEKVCDRLRDYQNVRAQYLIKLFGRVPDFLEKRDIYSGVASYILAISTYPFFEKKKFSPTIKMGVSSLRVAWLMGDLIQATKQPHFGELQQGFYKKAAEFYDRALANQSNASEPLDYCPWLGPDTDVNYGYDGFLYVNAVLKYKMSIFVEDPFEKVKIFESTKRILSKVFGIGRKARDKPEILLNMARDMYDKIGGEMDELQKSLGDIEELTADVPDVPDYDGPAEGAADDADGDSEE